MGIATCPLCEATCGILVDVEGDAIRSIRGDADDLAHVESKAGTLMAAIEVTDTIMPGVVSLPHGWGHDRDGTRLTVARQSPGVSVNDVTSEFEVDSLSGTAAFNGLAVNLRR